MNIKIIFSQPLLAREEIQNLIKEVEIFCACGVRLGTLAFQESLTCPECEREYHLQDGIGHFHVIVNKPTDETLLESWGQY